MRVDDVGGGSGRPWSEVVGTDARIIAMNSYVNVDVTLKVRPSPPATATRLLAHSAPVYPCTFAVLTI